MKKLLLLLLITPLIGLSQTTESTYEELIKKSPFNEMYPKIIAEDAAEYSLKIAQLLQKRQG